MVYVELSKFKVKTISELKTERDIWLYLLNNMETLTEEKRMEILAKKPDLKNAFDVLDLYASDPDKRRELEERLRADKNYAYELAAKYEQGLEQGLEKGELNKAIETARKMQELGLSKEIIEKSVGLSSERLKDLGIF
jgi:predicted transposase/invertase (TIGR01784 family)